jgi:4-amino-4-deoxy-L-arabinose transferase-like glycosyltransferase
MGLHIQDCWSRRETPEYPWPNRVGYFWLVAGAMRLTGDTSVNAGAALSAMASLLVLILTAWLGLKYLGGWTTAVALLFLATSPLDLAIAGRTWQDEVVAALTLIMLHLYIRALARPDRGVWPTLFFLVGAFALTVKETALLVLGAGTVGMLVGGRQSENRGRSAAWALGGAALAACAAAAWVVASTGGIEPMRKSYELWKLASVPNDYMRRYQMGGPEYYAIGLGILNAVPFALGLAGAVALALRAPFMRSRWSHPMAVGLLTSLAWLVVSYGLVACLHSQKNMRFLSVIFVPVFFLAASLVRSLLATLRERVATPVFAVTVMVVAVGLAASAVADLARFDHWFMVEEVPDLATPWFTSGGK